MHFWGDVVFTLTAVAVFPCFRVLENVMLKSGIDNGLRYVNSTMMIALLQPDRMVVE